MGDLQEMDIIMENVQQIEDGQFTEITETGETTEGAQAQQLSEEDRVKLEEFKLGANHRANIVYANILKLVSQAGDVIPEDLATALSDPYEDYSEKGFSAIGKARLIAMCEFLVGMDELAAHINRAALAPLAKAVVLEITAMFPQHRQEIYSRLDQVMIATHGLSSKPQAEAMMLDVATGKFFMDLVSILMRSRTDEAVLATYQYAYTWRDQSLYAQFMDSINVIAAILAECILPILSEADTEAAQRAEAEANAEKPTEAPMQTPKAKKQRKPRKPAAKKAQANKKAVAAKAK